MNINIFYFVFFVVKPKIRVRKLSLAETTLY